MRLFGLFLLALFSLPQLFSCSRICDCYQSDNQYIFSFDPGPDNYPGHTLDSLRIGYKSDTDLVYHLSEWSVFNGTFTNPIVFLPQNFRLGNRYYSHQISFPMSFGKDNQIHKIKSLIFYLKTDTVEFYNMEHGFTYSTDGNCQCLASVFASGKMNGQPYKIEDPQRIEFIVKKN